MPAITLLFPLLETRAYSLCTVIPLTPTWRDTLLARRHALQAITTPHCISIEWTHDPLQVIPVHRLQPALQRRLKNEPYLLLPSTLLDLTTIFLTVHWTRQHTTPTGFIYQCCIGHRSFTDVTEEVADTGTIPWTFLESLECSLACQAAPLTP